MMERFKPGVQVRKRVHKLQSETDEEVNIAKAEALIAEIQYFIQKYDREGFYVVDAVKDGLATPMIVHEDDMEVVEASQ